MPFGRKPQLTGPDYLIGAAQHLMDEGERNDFIRLFQDMVMTAILPEALPDMPISMSAEYAAKRPLEEYELAAVAVVSEAARVAVQRKDWKSLEEISRFGTAMVIKFREHLELTGELDSDGD